MAATDRERSSQSAELMRKIRAERRKAGVRELQILVKEQDRTALEQIARLTGGDVQKIAGALLAEAVRDYVARLPQLELNLGLPQTKAS